MVTMKNPGDRPDPAYAAGMTSSSLAPDDIRAAAEVHDELGPEYSDAVVAGRPLAFDATHRLGGGAADDPHVTVVELESIGPLWPGMVV